MARKYSSTSVDTTIATTALGPSDTSLTVASGADLTNGMGYTGGDTFIIAIAPDTAAEEICIVTGVSSNTLTITRAQAGTSATTHAIGTTVRHVLTSIELTDFETVRTNHVDKTTINAKGDLLAGTANDTIARLGVGTNGQVLAADSTQTTGLIWSTPVTATSTNTLTNKTIALGSNTVSGTTAQFNTALTDNDFATLAGTETLTNKTVNLSSNTLTGTTAQFNTALSDGDFATIAGTETLTNKTLTSPAINGATIATSNTRLAGVDEKTGNYTLVAGDASKLISVNSASNLTITVGSGVFSVGDVIYITRTGTGTVTIAASGTTLTSHDSNLKLRVRYSSAAIICTASNTFRVVGDLSA
jgi:hypothetical protein